MRIADFDLYKELLYGKSGLTLGPDKSYLVDSRLTPVAKKWGYESLDEMTLVLRGMPDPKMVDDIVEAMTTNETSFYRDSRPFDIFKDTVLPYLMSRKHSAPRLRIWCAACSSGQEPYSIAMLLKEHQAILKNKPVEIYATDLSKDILEQAQTGNYSQFEVQRGLPVQMLVKYFEQVGDRWNIKDEIKNMVTYKPFNLLDSMDSFGMFDVVFCRNVLIYFDEKTKADILNRLAKRLPEDGFLYLGGAETVLGITEEFKPLPNHRGLYVKKAAPHPLEAASTEAQPAKGLFGALQK